MTVTVSPTARYCARPLSSAKFQLIVPLLKPATLPVRESAELRAETRSAETDEPVEAEAVQETIVAVEMSASSASVKSNEPLVTRLVPLRSAEASSVTVASKEPVVMMGASFEPVTLISTVWSSVPPLPSETEMV